MLWSHALLLVLLQACSSTGGGNSASGGASGQGGRTAGGGTQGTQVTGGTPGQGGVSSTGGVAGHSGAGGAAGMTGAAGDPRTGGRSGVGGMTGPGGSGGTAGTSDGAAGTQQGGASGSGAGGTGGPTGSGGQGAGGQIGTGGTGGTTLTCPPPASGSSYTVDADSVTFTVGSGKLRLQVCAEDTIRVQSTSAAAIPNKTSLAISNTWDTPPVFCVTESSGTVTITTARMKARVNTSTGLVSYTDASDKVVLAEASKSTTAATVEGTSTYKIQTSFSSPSGEALFGLGQHQSSVMNRKGTSVQILNTNTQINIPVLVSNKGYGIYWDNYSTSSFSSNSSSFTYSSEAGEGVDYYFFYGPTMDQIIAAYRMATGAAPLFPKWAYGLFQSKDHYSSQPS